MNFNYIHYLLRGFKSTGLVFDICQTKLETNLFLFSLKSNVDENESLSYHTTHKNDQNLLKNDDGR